jgi:predicted RNase H-like nuclease
MLKNGFYVGIDGCPAGWFSVCIGPKNQVEYDIFSSFEEVWNQHKDATAILVDIPIGLPWRDFPRRQCDRRARQVLSPLRHNSVFSPPCRETMDAENYTEACNINEENCGRMLSMQTWNIIPKIRQADKLLTTKRKARNIIRETHPEVCFWGLAGGTPMAHYKGTREGLQERLEVLQHYFQRSDEIYEAAIELSLRRDVARDDILDALVNAITATRLEKHGKTLPTTPPRDQKDLPMEMVYSAVD